MCQGQQIPQSCLLGYCLPKNILGKRVVDPMFEGSLAVRDLFFIIDNWYLSSPLSNRAAICVWHTWNPEGLWSELVCRWGIHEHLRKCNPEADVSWKSCNLIDWIKLPLSVSITNILRESIAFTWIWGNKELFKGKYEINLVKSKAYGFFFWKFAVQCG